MKSLPNQIEVTEAAKPLSLEELYELGTTYGDVKIGTIFNTLGCEIKLAKTGEDYVNLKCTHHNTVKKNLQEVIKRAEVVTSLYKQF